MKNRMQPKLYILSLLLMTSILLSGCGFKDIDKRFFVVGAGIDYSGDEKKPYRITIKLAIPSVSIDPGNSKSQVESINTASIADGIRLLKAQVDKEIDFGHCNVILLGEELANRYISDAVQWMSRRRDIQNIASIGIGRPSAEEVISKQPKIERFPGSSLNLFFSKDATESSYTYVELLTDLFRRINEKGLDPVLPIVEIQPDATYIVNKIALLNKTKIVTILEPKETQLYNQISGHLKQSSLFGSFHSVPYVVAINKMKTRYSIEQKSNPLVTMKIKQDISFEEVPQQEIFGDTQKALIQLQQQFSQETQSLLQKIQQAGVDPLGFGLRYRANYDLNNFDEKWPGIYQSLQFDVTSKMKIQGAGLLK